MHYVRGYVLQLLNHLGQRAPQVRDVGTQGLVTDRDVGSLG